MPPTCFATAYELRHDNRMQKGCSKQNDQKMHVLPQHAPVNRTTKVCRFTYQVKSKVMLVKANRVTLMTGFTGAHSNLLHFIYAKQSYAREGPPCHPHNSINRFPAKTQNNHLMSVPRSTNNLYEAIAMTSLVGAHRGTFKSVAFHIHKA